MLPVNFRYQAIKVFRKCCFHMFSLFTYTLVASNHKIRHLKRSMKIFMITGFGKSKYQVVYHSARFCSVLIVLGKKRGKRKKNAEERERKNRSYICTIFYLTVCEIKSLPVLFSDHGLRISNFGGT